MSIDLAEDNYYVSKGGRIPLKWTAPEALHYRKYSTASDIWSYGCLLYEIWSLGYKPFSAFTNAEVVWACIHFILLLGTMLLWQWYTFLWLFRLWDKLAQVTVFHLHLDVLRQSTPSWFSAGKEKSTIDLLHLNHSPHYHYLEIFMNVNNITIKTNSPYPHSICTVN